MTDDGAGRTVDEVAATAACSIESYNSSRVATSAQSPARTAGELEETVGRFRTDSTRIQA